MGSIKYICHLANLNRTFIIFKLLAVPEIIVFNLNNMRVPLDNSC